LVSFETESEPCNAEQDDIGRQGEFAGD
jgi:hypothetical protein